MTSLGLLSIVPPVIALILALWKKKIIPALLVGGLAASLLLAASRWTFVVDYLERVIKVTGDRGNLQLILFGVLVGGLIKLMETSGGFKGMISLLESLNIRTKRPVFILTWAIGLLMILENYSNIMVNGTTVGSLYDKLGIPRAKLAYFLHSISINWVAIIVFNSWGAFYMMLLSAQGVTDPFPVVLSAMPMNFYCIVSLIVIIIAMVFDWNIGPMKKYVAAVAKSVPATENPKDKGAGTTDPEHSSPITSLLVIVPVLVLVATMLISLVATGGGSMLKGDGTASVFYAVLAAIAVLALMVQFRPKSERPAIEKSVYSGIGDFMEVGILLALALTLGSLCKEMGTGDYIAGLAKGNVPTFLMPLIFFFVSCLISFATGTSYGTFSIMVPLAVPVAQAMNIPLPLMFAACISGGVFGDNTSPFSDTSVITAISAKTGVVEHVEAQLPYALVSASFAGVMFVIAGWLMV
ncbi:MAG: C4-dicarboxylate transporter [Bacteroidetes bacterium]|nr:C4-dicarboxylate transporter [Bacteroidota bacterium]